MSVPLESGTALASISGPRAEVLTEWKSFKVDPGSLPAQWHSKFWGKSMAHEEQKWCDTQLPMPMEGSGLGGEEMGVDVTESDSDDDFIKGCYFLDIDIDGTKTSRIWIRAEYIRIYKAVEIWYNFRGSSHSGRAPAAVITGQPGIGKSVWIYYALRRRLAKRKSVIWYHCKKRYLFVDEGVYKVPDDFQEFRVFVWTLVDSDYAKDGVPEDLVMRNTRHFVIYCTSPSQKRWSRLHKTVYVKTFIMNPWKRKEIFRVVDALPPEIKVDRERVNAVFDELGPTPRLCIDYLRSAQIEQYKWDIKTAISALTISELEQLFLDTNSLTLDNTSHKIYIISRRDRENVSSLAIVSPITSSIKFRLASHFQTLELREQIRLYKSFSKVPDSSAMAGIFFGAAGQRCLQGGVELEFVPMVQLASSSTGKPQWHSSHVFFQNNAELERLRQEALQQRQTLVIPKHLEHASLPIKSDIIYVPELTSQAALDSFIVTNNHLYIFQFTTGGEHSIKPELMNFVCRYPELPSMDNWHFISILPPNHILKCQQPWGQEMRELHPYSAVIDLDKWYRGMRP